MTCPDSIGLCDAAGIVCTHDIKNSSCNKLYCAVCAVSFVVGVTATIQCCQNGAVFTVTLLSLSLPNAFR